ncbi:MAG: 50S ribosomal protein L13 [Candidatus Bathyarchaeota archaeon]
MRETKVKKRKKNETSNFEKNIAPICVTIDASGLILGRLASTVAKKLLMGERVTVINAEKAVISGSKKKTVEEFKKNLTTRTLGSQTKAPKHARRPENFVGRVIRGMVPWKRKPRGKIAFRKLRVYSGLPIGIKESSVQTIPKAKRDTQSFMTVGELMKIFGWKSFSEPIKVTNV